MIFNFIFAPMANRSNCRNSILNFNFWCALHLQYYRLAAHRYCYRIEMWNRKERVRFRANDAKREENRKLFTNPTNVQLPRTNEHTMIIIMEYSMVYGARCASFTNSSEMQVIQMEVSRKRNLSHLCFNRHSTCFQFA